MDKFEDKKFDMLVTGDFTGKIKCFNIDNYENTIEINAHVRTITSLCVNVLLFY